MKRSLPAAGGAALLAALVLVATGSGGCAKVFEEPYPGASHVPDSRPGWERHQLEVPAGAPQDEAQGGRTARGTPVTPRPDVCFPAETRNVFYQVDMVASGPDGALEPFDYSTDGKIGKDGREAIRGQNTWMLWGEGNEAFWGWLQEQGYGLVDFLILLDSRKRGTRFRDTGLMNQPGMKARTDQAGKVLGLYLDQADGEAILMKQPDGDVDQDTGALAVRPPQPTTIRGGKRHPTALFEPGDRELYEGVIRGLPQDGVDTTIYGYPSGVVGLRLMPNPDFFGSTDEAARARRYWDERVVRARDDAFYTDPSINADPDLVRPFRVSMACGFCHVGPHPLNPPSDPEKPGWENMSSLIGNQYWSPPKVFANLTHEDSSFLFHFIASQQPGTIDTSLVSTDHINNSNTINAVFDVPARMERAMGGPPRVTPNPAEKQSAPNLLLAAFEERFQPVTPRHTPRVLVDGSDSVGVDGALSRVYLNIGTFPEEWSRCHNPIIGFKPQRPFTVATLRKNSSFWRAAERERIPFLRKFFTYKSAKTKQSITAPMKLRDAGPEGRAVIQGEQALAAQGRDVFLANCAVCHSSKQPEGFGLTFSREWAKQPGDGRARLTLPMDSAEWDGFKASGAYKAYVALLRNEAGLPEAGRDPFLEDNFLSTDMRVPVTLTGTNSARAVATNAMRGQVWDNFSSDTYKELPAVGAVHFYNPYSGKGVDAWLNNDTYRPPGGGPGYYRPASLISVWATAPYLHNNALGLYNHDPSVKGRLAAFEDGIDKLLWRARRGPGPRPNLGDLRSQHPDLAGSDLGFIYRTTRPTYIAFAGKFVRPLLHGLLGPFLTSFVTFYLWIVLAIGAVVLAILANPRHAGFVLLLVAVVLATLVALTRLDRVWWALWALPVVATAAALWFWLARRRALVARVFFLVLAVVALALGIVLRMFTAGGLGGLSLGPIPQGTPVNLIMNMNPEAPPGAVLKASSALARGLLMVRARGLTGADALRTFEREAALPLMAVSKCPDFVLDRGHWFGESLTDDEKKQLKAFLKTL